MLQTTAFYIVVSKYNVIMSITTHPQKRMNSTYIVRGGLQKCPTHPAKRMICWVLGLEVEVGLQIGVILQVVAPAPKQKMSP
jgi:hypothetical protein